MASPSSRLLFGRRCLVLVFSLSPFQSPPKGITVPYRPLKPVTAAVAGLGVAGTGSPVVSQSAAAAAAAAVAAAATSQASYLSGSANGQQAAAAAAAALNNPSAAALLPGNQVGDSPNLLLFGDDVSGGTGGACATP